MTLRLLALSATALAVSAAGAAAQVPLNRIEAAVEAATPQVVE